MAGPVDLYAVMGNPVSQSKSPLVHSLFASQTDQRLRYTAREVPVDGFQEAIQHFFKEENGGHGLSITIPFKEQAWQLAQKRSSRADKAGAVNTLWMDSDGVLQGENTDGVGLVRDLTKNHNVSLNGAKVLLLGAGGAVRGVIEPILEQAPAELVIANRTVSKAEALVSIFQNDCLSACGFSDLTGPFDVIINGTSASLHGDLPPLPESIVSTNIACYDMMYTKNTTVFNQWAMDKGARKVMDGLGMLLEQAAEQFYLWRGVRPDTAPVIERLREEMKA